MRRFIVLLIITGTVWAQTGLDKLVLDDGTEFLGEYSEVRENVVYFKRTNGLSFQGVPINRIRSLQLKDGKTIIEDEYVKIRTILDYEHLSINDKAIYDAKKDAKKWLFIAPTAASSIFGAIMLSSGVEILPDPAILVIIAASLTLPYLGGLNLGKTENFSSKDKKLYEEMYHKEFKKEKLKNIIIGIVLAPLLGFTILVLSSDDSDNNDWRLPSFPP